MSSAGAAGRASAAFRAQRRAAALPARYVHLALLSLAPTIAPAALAAVLLSPAGPDAALTTASKRSGKQADAGDAQAELM